MLEISQIIIPPQCLCILFIQVYVPTLLFFPIPIVAFIILFYNICLCAFIAPRLLEHGASMILVSLPFYLVMYK